MKPFVVLHWLPDSGRFVCGHDDGSISLIERSTAFKLYAQLGDGGMRVQDVEQLDWREIDISVTFNPAELGDVEAITPKQYEFDGYLMELAYSPKARMWVKTNEIQRIVGLGHR